MGLLNRMKNLWNLSKRSFSTMNDGGFFDLFLPNSSGEHVSERRAMHITTVWVCQLILAESLASLTWAAHKSTAAGSEIAIKHSVQNILRNGPNPWMTFNDFIKALIWSASGYGGGYAQIIRDGYNNAIGLKFWDCPGEVVVFKDNETGQPLYLYKGKTYSSEDLIIIKRFTLDGVTPLSPIRFNAETLGFAIKQTKYKNNTFGSKPPGYMTSDANITKEQMPLIQEHAKNFKKATLETGDIPVLYNGLKYLPISFSPQDLQLLETSKSTKEDIYAMFRIPPVFAQNYERATFDNAEKQDLVLGKYTLLPWIKCIEEEFNKKLFKVDEPEYYVKGNMNTLLRADYKTRTEGYAKLFSIGVLSQNDIRQLEDLNKVEGGDRLYLPMNMAPSDRMDDLMNKLTSPSTAKQVASDEVRSFKDLLESMGVKLQTNGHSHSHSEHES
jgi:HK97 family phage portal protein